jgi:hypothetical protein
MKIETEFMNMLPGLAHELIVLTELNSELATRNSLSPD